MEISPKRRRIAAAVLAAAAAVLLVWQCSVRRPQRTPACYTRTFPVMGTIASVCFYGLEPAAAEQALLAVQREFDAVSHACNLYDDESELVRLNRNAALSPVAVSPLLWKLLAEADRAHRLSGGAFDVSVKPLMDLWGFYRKRQTPPQPAELVCARELTGWERVRLDPEKHTVFFARPGMALDFGGIAKGYALDRAAAAVETLGVRSGVIDLGGNLRLLRDAPPGEKCYRVAVKDPASPQRTLPGVMELPGDCAVSTSGNYERFVILAGKKYGHIVDPASGEAPLMPHAVTVVAPAAVTADWASTALYLRGRGLAESLQKNTIIRRYGFFSAPAANR